VTVIRLQGKEYRVRGEHDPEHLRAVADHVDRVLQEIQRTTADTQDVPILVALNIASDLLYLRRNEYVPAERLQSLIDLLDRV
jgi:cell division protein ZapA (FtsZ GTPase activity inhibitor)